MEGQARDLPFPFAVAAVKLGEGFVAGPQFCGLLANRLRYVVGHIV